MEAYLAIHIPQQMARTNTPNPTSWLRAINKFGEDAQSGFGAVYLRRCRNVEGARVCQWKLRCCFEICSWSSETASERAAMDGIIHDEGVGDVRLGTGSNKMNGRSNSHCKGSRTRPSSPRFPDKVPRQGMYRAPGFQRQRLRVRQCHRALLTPHLSRATP